MAPYDLWWLFLASLVLSLLASSALFLLKAAKRPLHWFYSRETLPELWWRSWFKHANHDREGGNDDA